MDQLCRPQAQRRTIAEFPSDHREHWHDVGREFRRAYPVGNSQRGFNASWALIRERTYVETIPCRREITPPKRRFWYNPGEYMLVSYEPAKTPFGDVYYCGADGVVRLGTSRDRAMFDIGDLVVAHHDPEAFRLRMMRRADERTWMESGKVFTTKRGGPLEGLDPGERFAFSWGLGATITKLGPRVAYFRPDHAHEAGPVDRQLTSEETAIVTSR